MTLTAVISCWFCSVAFLVWFPLVFLSFVGSSWMTDFFPPYFSALTFVYLVVLWLLLPGLPQSSVLSQDLQRHLVTHTGVTWWLWGCHIFSHTSGGSLAQFHVMRLRLGLPSSRAPELHIGPRRCLAVALFQLSFMSQKAQPQSLVLRKEPGSCPSAHLALAKPRSKLGFSSRHW